MRVARVLLLSLLLAGCVLPSQSTSPAPLPARHGQPPFGSRVYLEWDAPNPHPDVSPGEDVLRAGDCVGARLVLWNPLARAVNATLVVNSSTTITLRANETRFALGPMGNATSWAELCAANVTGMRHSGASILIDADAPEASGFQAGFPACVFPRHGSPDACAPPSTGAAQNQTAPAGVNSSG